MCCIRRVLDRIGGVRVLDRIGGVTVSVLASSVVNHGLELLSDYAKEYEIGICCCLDQKQDNFYLLTVFRGTSNI